MNEETQRLLPAALLTLALHSAFFSWQMENRSIELPKPENISVTLKKSPPPPPPQQKIVKELLPPPDLKPAERQPLETLPPPQSKVVKRLKPPPAIKKAQHKPLEQLPPPAAVPAALAPLETLPPAQARMMRTLPPPPDIAAVVAAPPAQSRVFRQLPRLPAEFAVSQPALRPVTVQEEIVYEEEIVEAEPAHEEIVEEYTPPPVEQFAEVVEEQVWEEPPRRVQPQRQSEIDYASSGAGNQDAAPLYASNPPPEYPMQARRRGLQGVVVIEAFIDVSGNVSDLRLFSHSGHSILDKATVSAVRGWRFQPGTVGGRRKAMWGKVPVRFELN